MGRLIQSYQRIYFESPRTADDLISYMELKDGLKEEKLFLKQYKFLKKHRKDIFIYDEGENTGINYKNIQLNLAQNDVLSYCDNERGQNGEMSFFGSDGLPILGKRYEHYLKELQSRLWPIGYKNRNKAWQKQKGHIFEDPIILEYTKANGLVNVCSKEKIDVESSLFYQDLYDVLEQFSKEYSIPRIILDGYIPKF